MNTEQLDRVHMTCQRTPTQCSPEHCPFQHDDLAHDECFLSEAIHWWGDGGAFCRAGPGYLVTLTPESVTCRACLEWMHA